MARLLLSITDDKKDNYVFAVENCGGEAVAVYLTENNADGYDGLILCGGNDISPALYQEEINGAVDIDYERDKCEWRLIKAFIEAQKPILGICRGCQLLNVYFGGTLYQHLENTNTHRIDGVGAIHEITAVKGSVAYELYGERFIANSFHHQAVKKLGANLVATQYCDNVIEGFEHDSLPIIAFQWHPEKICFSKRLEDTVDGGFVFEYFLKICENNIKR